MSTLSANPLAKHFRQPVMYFKLPSEGRWYPDGSLDLPATGEVPIYPMTAKDELTLKTPDALMNGAGTVSVIESCCPSIKDAWKMPAVDVDPLILAIRLATYGKAMEFKCICPACQTSNERAIDITVMLDRIHPNPNWGKSIVVNDLEIMLRPQSFEELNDANMLNFEEAQLMRLLSDESLTEEQKVLRFNEAFKKIVAIGVAQLSRSIAGIRTPEGTLVDDHKFIVEFLENCDRKVWDDIRVELESIRDQTDYNKVDITCENPECKTEFIAPFVLEQSNFFV